MLGKNEVKRFQNKEDAVEFIKELSKKEIWYDDIEMYSYETYYWKGYDMSTMTYGTVYAVEYRKRSTLERIALVLFDD